MTIHHISQAIANMEQDRQERIVTGWGNWYFIDDPACLVLTKDGYYAYDIRVTDMTDSARTLDWIMQVASKSWVTPEDVGNLVLAINDLLEPQSSMCGGGKNRTIDPSNFLPSRT
jgi:hypothetical protein